MGIALEPKMVFTTTGMYVDVCFANLNVVVTDGVEGNVSYIQLWKLWE